MALVLPRPAPNITWRKDGEQIVDGEDGYYLPGHHYNRLLIIKHVTQEHQGNYTCTAYPTSSSFDQASVSTFLTVKGLKRNMLQIHNYQLSNTPRKFGDQVLGSTSVVLALNCLLFQWQPVGVRRHWQQNALSCRRRYRYHWKLSRGTMKTQQKYRGVVT